MALGVSACPSAVPVCCPFCADTAWPGHHSGFHLGHKRRLRKSSKAAAGKSAPAAASAGKGGQAIVALINDEPISGYDVEQRINLLLLTSGSVNERLKAKLQDPGINEKFKQFVLARNPNIRSQEEIKAMQAQFVTSMRSQVLSEARPGQRKAALEEIIDERIKIQAAKKLNIPVNEADVTASIMEIAKKNGKDEKAFAAMLAGMGVNINSMKDRFRAGIAWRDVVRRQFGHQISIGQQDIEKAVASASGGPNAGTLTDLALVKVLLPFPAKSDEKAKAARFADAEKIRQNFTNCRATPALVQTVERGEIRGPRHTRSRCLSRADPQCPDQRQGGRNDTPELRRRRGRVVCGLRTPATVRRGVQTR